MTYELLCHPRQGDQPAWARDMHFNARNQAATERPELNKQ